MPKIIKDRAIIEDATILLAKDAEVPKSLSSDILTPLPMWLANREQFSSSSFRVGVWLDSDDEIEQLEDSLHQLDLIAINFPVFVDGRGFSSARLLRERYNYSGELRAIGNFIRDQLFYLQRCGFNSFQFAGDVDLQAALSSLVVFSDCYQPASDQTQPLFRRR